MFFRQHTDVVQSHERALQKSLPKALYIIKINILLEFLIKKLTLESIIKYQFLCTKMVLSIKDFFSKCGHIISLLECFTLELRGIFRTLSETPFRKKCRYSEFSWFVFKPRIWTFFTQRSLWYPVSFDTTNRHDTAKHSMNNKWGF